MKGRTAHQVAPLSDEDIQRRMVEDPRFVVETCFSIINKQSQRVPYLFNNIQNMFYEDSWMRPPDVPGEAKMDIVDKSRKMGLSAAILALFTAICVTRKHTRAVVISEEHEATKRLFGRVTDYIKHSIIPIKVSQESSTGYTFPNTESMIYIGTAGAKAFSRGDDLNLVHLSEVSRYPNQEVITGCQEAMVANGWIIQESTAFGAGNPFHRAWVRSINGESKWRWHFYGWHQSHEYRIPGAPPFDLTPDEASLKRELNLDWEQLAWRRSKIESMNDPSLFPQEYPATWEESFLVSGRMVFDWKAIRRQEAACQLAKWTGDIVDIGSGIEVKPDPRGPFTVYMTPQEGKKYLVVADAADGVKGGAFSVADVYDIRTWEQVAQWRGHLSPADFADLLMRLGAFYGWAVVAPECNYPGNAVLERMQTAAYPSIYSEPDTPNGRMGWMTTTQSKAQYISDGRRALDDGSLKINSKATLAELRTFMLADGGKMQPQEGCWQDTVVVCCKAANILKDMRWEPERTKRSFRDVMGMPRRSQTGPSGGEYQAKVV